MSLEKAETAGSSQKIIHIERPLFNQAQFETFADFQQRQELTVTEKLVRQQEKYCACSGKNAKRVLFRFLPILTWLPKYRWRKSTLADVIAGITVGIMQIPQGMAYATLAGMEPVYGLYVSFFPSLVYFFFGTSRHISVGTFSVISVMVANTRFRLAPPISESTYQFLKHHRENHTIEPELSPLVVVTSLTLLVGFIQLAMGILQIGFFATYLSEALISGFTTAAAVHVLANQVPKLIGVKIRPRTGPLNLFYGAWDFFDELPRTNVPTLIISLISISILIFVKAIVEPQVHKRIPVNVPLPIDFLLIVAADLASHYGNFSKRFHLEIVGHVPVGLPGPIIPRFDIMKYMIKDAVSIAVVIFAISVSLSKSFAKKRNYTVDANQELYAFGIVQCFSSFFSCFASSASVSRSAVNDNAGAKSQIASLISTSVVLFSILFLDKYLESLPMCVLSSIIVVALRSMFMQAKELRNIWPVSKVDTAVWIISFGGTIFMDVSIGLQISLAFVFAVIIIRTQWPYWSFLNSVKNTDIYASSKYFTGAEDSPMVKIFHYNAPLMFANVQLFKALLYEKCFNQAEFAKLQKLYCPKYKKGSSQIIINPTSALRNPQLPKAVIVDCSSFSYVDPAGVACLKSIFEELKELKINLMLACCAPHVMQSFLDCGLNTVLPDTNIFPTVHDARTFCAENG